MCRRRRARLVAAVRVQNASRCASARRSVPEAASIARGRCRQVPELDDSIAAIVAPLTTTVAFATHLPRAIEHTRRADPDVPLLRVNDGRRDAAPERPAVLTQCTARDWIVVIPSRLRHGASTRSWCCRSSQGLQRKCPRGIREMRKHVREHPSSVRDRRILLIRRKLWLPACSHISPAFVEMVGFPRRSRTAPLASAKLEAQEAQHQLEGLPAAALRRGSSD